MLKVKIRGINAQYFLRKLILYEAYYMQQIREAVASAPTPQMPQRIRRTIVRSTPSRFRSAKGYAAVMVHVLLANCKRLWNQNWITCYGNSDRIRVIPHLICGCMPFFSIVILTWTFCFTHVTLIHQTKDNHVWNKFMLRHTMSQHVSTFSGSLGLD